MKTFAAVSIAWLICYVVLAGEISREPRMALPERVAAAKLIVLGKFGPPGNTGKHTTTSVLVAEVLRGSLPKGQTLWVSYTSSLWLIPEVAAYPGPVAQHGSRWVFFLTDTDVKHVRGTNYYTRAVGPQKYAHDGFELANDEVVRQVRDLIAEGKTKTNTVPRVAISNLLTHMKDYRGKRVEVTGYYKSGFELSALYQNQDDARSLRDAQALWIMPFMKPDHEKQVKFVKEGTVRIVGVFDYNVRQPELGVGHLGQWPAQLVALEVFEEIK
jgi:hypothetical protein